MMTSLKMWCLLPLAVLLLSIAPTVTEVVQSMAQCDGFLLYETSPQIPGILENGKILNPSRYKPICQTYENKRRFVTLYDTENKIPVFSAYKFRGVMDRRPKNHWKIEPQLEERESMINICHGKYQPTESQINMCRDIPQHIYEHQASNDDYKNNQHYCRGHLFPSGHAANIDEKKSTFTLTNAVPQAITFNSGSWEKMESCVKCVLEKYCKNNYNVIEGFVLTGAKNGTKELNNKINIPSMLWSAFCCYSGKKNKWLASAYWGDNVQEPEPTFLETKTLEELHQELRIEVFPPMCPRDKTVAEYYNEINHNNKSCSCPPQPSTTSAPPTTTTASNPMRNPKMRLICRKPYLGRAIKYTVHQYRRLRYLCQKPLRYQLGSYTSI